MKLNYNNETRTTSNTEGVITEIPGFGNSSVVEWIDPSKASPGAYYRYLADVLVEQGYVRDISIRGAPYDFRKGPSKLSVKSASCCTFSFDKPETNLLFFKNR